MLHLACSLTSVEGASISGNHVATPNEGTARSSLAGTGDNSIIALRMESKSSAVEPYGAAPLGKRTASKTLEAKPAGTYVFP
jgi:hypothetical protein